MSTAWRQSSLKLNTAIADSLSSLMIITAVALILPTALYSALEVSKPLDLEKQISTFSYATAIVLLILYTAYLYFELGSHKYLFDSQPGESATSGYIATEQEISHDHAQGMEQGTRRETAEQNSQQTARTSSLITTTTALICSAVGIIVCSNFLVASIDEASKVTNISRTFIATILIPIASNAPECAVVLESSRNGRIDFALGVITGSVLQIALL